MRTGTIRILIRYSEKMSCYLDFWNVSFLRILLAASNLLLVYQISKVPRGIDRLKWRRFHYGHEGNHIGTKSRLILFPEHGYFSGGLPIAFIILESCV